MLDVRFARQDAKMEARFSSIEKSIESTKVWATLLYAGLAAVVFGGLAVDHVTPNGAQRDFRRNARGAL
jgi:hypothetical protein